VVEADARSYPADVLVLKYAQALYGVDKKAAETVGLDESRLPDVGEYLRVDSPRGFAAKTLLFLGVVQLRTFGYGEIRDFGRRALALVASESPHARAITLTLHGAGYGLDETEAFDSELAGVLDAIREREVPPALERVVFVETSPGRADRMRKHVGHLLRNMPPLTKGEPFAELLPRPTADHFRRVGYESSQRGHAFVAMPFATGFDDLFHYGITNAVRTSGLLCERVDRRAFTGDIVSHLLQQIETARIVVADLTDSNPNVLLEVGYAWGKHTPTVLLCHTESDLAFDVRGHRCLRYSGIKEAEDLLTEELNSLLSSPRTTVPSSRTV
jgi:hypothetical protein